MWAGRDDTMIQCEGRVYGMAWSVWNNQETQGGGPGLLTPCVEQSGNPGRGAWLADPLCGTIRKPREGGLVC